MKTKIIIILLTLKSFLSFSQSNCELKFTIDSVMKTYPKENIFIVNNFTDECKFAIVDGLTNKYLSSKGVKYIKFLSHLYSFSDGVFTDNMYFNGSRIFDSSLLEWFLYLYKNKKDTNAIKFFTQSVSSKMSANKEIEASVNNKLDSLSKKITKEQNVFLKTLRKQLDPKKFE